MRKPDVRAQILSESNDPDPKNKLGLRVRNFNDMFPLGDPPNYEPPAETSIANLSKARGVTPEEVAALTAFLLGPEAGAITGQQILVCGGSSL